MLMMTVIHSSKYAKNGRTSHQFFHAMNTANSSPVYSLNISENIDELLCNIDKGKSVFLTTKHSTTRKWYVG